MQPPEAVGADGHEAHGQHHAHQLGPRRRPVQLVAQRVDGARDAEAGGWRGQEGVEEDGEGDAEHRDTHAQEEHGDQPVEGHLLAEDHQGVVERDDEEEGVGGQVGQQVEGSAHLAQRQPRVCLGAGGYVLVVVVVVVAVVVVVVACSGVTVEADSLVASFVASGVASLIASFPVSFLLAFLSASFVASLSASFVASPSAFFVASLSASFVASLVPSFVASFPSSLVASPFPAVALSTGPIRSLAHVSSSSPPPPLSPSLSPPSSRGPSVPNGGQPPD